MVKCTGRGLVVKQPGVLSKVQMLNLVLGGGLFPSSKNRPLRRGGRGGFEGGVRGGAVPNKPKDGTRAHLPKPPFYKTAPLFPLDLVNLFLTN